MDNLLVKAAITDFFLQYSLFLVAVCLKTDKFFFLSGSATFFVTVQSLFHTGTMFPRQVIQSTMVCVWGMRLGIFLIFRMWRDGHDNRFNHVKDNPKLFFLFWTVEGLWVWLTLLPTLIINSKHVDSEFCISDYMGWSLWLIGMLLECVADYQKYVFRGNSANKDKWISNGLWSIIRHPNYLGEILLWIGLFISATSTFTERWELLSVISPMFVAFLLTCVSGIPRLEQLNWNKWKENPKFCQYMKNTPKLIPYLY